MTCHIMVLPQARCCGSDEEVVPGVKGTTVKVQILQGHLQKPTHGSLLSLGWDALFLATLCAHGALGGTTRLLCGRRFGSSHRRRYSGIVGFDPGPHAFWRFHIKACLLSHEHKGLGHAKVSGLLQ